MHELPLLRDTSLGRREALFKQKLQPCCVMDFHVCCTVTALILSHWQAGKAGKDLKRNTLLELVEHVTSAGGQKLLIDAVLEDVVNMVQVCL